MKKRSSSRIWPHAHGVLPVIIPLTSEQDEVTRVINEIRQLAQNGVPWRICCSFTPVGRRSSRLLVG
jgi:hypothetical protein